MALKYVQPTEQVIILINTLSQWQKDFLNKTLEFRDEDCIGAGFEGKVYPTLCYGKYVDGSSSWIMIDHYTAYPVIQFNDIFIEE